MADPQHLPAVVIVLPAEIDMANADRVGQQLGAALAPGVATVIADMTATRFCDSSGISMLVQAHGQAAANGTELRLVVASAAVLRTLTLTGLDQLLPIYPSLSQALPGTLSGVGPVSGVVEGRLLTGARPGVLVRRWPNCCGRWPGCRYSAL